MLETVLEMALSSSAAAAAAGLATVILTSLLVLHRPVPAPKVPPPPLGSQGLLTYNVHSCVGEDTVYDVGRVASVVRSTGASVVCLQEIEANVGAGGKARVFSETHADDQPATIARECGMDHVYFEASLRASVASEGGPEGEVLQHDPDVQYGNAIISRFPILRRESLHYTQQTQERGANTAAAAAATAAAAARPIRMSREEQPRSAQAALIELPLPTLPKEHPDGAAAATATTPTTAAATTPVLVWVVNTHFCHIPGHPYQRRQARQLLEWLDGFTDGRPVLLSGDFNGPPYFPGCAYRTILAGTAQCGGEWKDLFLQQPNAPPHFSTVPTSVYRRGRDWLPRDGWGKWLLGRLTHARIDYTLSLWPRDPQAPVITAARCRVVNDTREALVASDHCGLLSELCLVVAGAG